MRFWTGRIRKSQRVSIDWQKRNVALEFQREQKLHCLSKGQVKLWLSRCHFCWCQSRESASTQWQYERDARVRGALTAAAVSPAGRAAAGGAACGAGAAVARAACPGTAAGAGGATRPSPRPRCHPQSLQISNTCGMGTDRDVLYSRRYTALAKFLVSILLLPPSRYITHFVTLDTFYTMLP